MRYSHKLTTISLPFFLIFLAACSQTVVPVSTPIPILTITPTAPAPPTSTTAPLPIATTTPTSAPTATITPFPTADLPTLTPLPPLASGARVTITRIVMVDAKNGWGMDSLGRILRTEDGGQAWADASPPKPGYRLGSALDASTAWAVPDGHLQVNDGFAYGYSSARTWRTVDGGKSWQASEPFSLMRGYPDIIGGVMVFSAAVQFLDRQAGWLLLAVDCDNHGSCGWQLYQTADGGSHWARVNDSERMIAASGVAPLLLSTVFADDKTGWAAGALIGWRGSDQWNAQIYQTADGGRTWTGLPVPPPANLPTEFQGNQVDCGAIGLGKISGSALTVISECMVFSDTDPHFYFYHLTPDGGKTWRVWPLDGGAYFFDPLTGWRLAASAGGGYNLQVTHDSAQTWQTLRRVAWHVAWEGQMDFIDENTGWIIARIGDQSALLMTVDGGKTSREIKPVGK